MIGRQRHVVFLGALIGAVSIALFLGAAERGSADTVGPTCAGKPLCVTVTDQAQASRTPAGGDPHYLTDTVVVSNGGTSSNLTNLTVTISWRDLPSGVPTTTAYEDGFSSSDCSEVATNTLTCTVPKSLGPGAFRTYELVFRTATNADADDFELTATATAKEQAKPSKGGAPPNDAAISVTNTTTYEGLADVDISIGGDGISTTLATANSGAQSSKLHVPADADRDLYRIVETDCPAGGSDCIGQSVTTEAAGLAPVNLQITYTGPLPSGTNENNVVVLHTRDGDTDPTVIDEKCSGELFSGVVDEDEIPCRRVKITRLGTNSYLVQVDAWDIINGEWGFS